MDFPILILAKDCGDILKFDSIQEMQHRLEKIDVENDEYDAWDRNGMPLKLTVQQPEWLHIEAQSRESEVEKVKELIRVVARRAGVDAQEEQSKNLVALFDDVNARVSKRRR
jgi:hypothetical protein